MSRPRSQVVVATYTYDAFGSEFVEVGVGSPGIVLSRHYVFDGRQIVISNTMRTLAAEGNMGSYPTTLGFPFSLK